MLATRLTRAGAFRISSFLASILMETSVDLPVSSTAPIGGFRKCGQAKGGAGQNQRRQEPPNVIPPDQHKCLFLRPRNINTNYNDYQIKLICCMPDPNAFPNALRAARARHRHPHPGRRQLPPVA